MSYPFYCEDDEWELFCDAIPIAYEAALFWVRTSPKAVKAQRTIRKAEGGRDPYYANLCSELNSLTQSIKRIRGSGALNIPRGCCSEVLDLLEKACTPVRKRDKVPQTKNKPIATYGQLYELLLQARVARIEQMQLAEKMRFKEKKIEQRIETIRRLTECAKSLENLVPLKDGEKWASQNWQKKNVQQIYSRSRRSLINRLHQLLTKHWTCKCTPHSNVHLLMDLVGQPSAHKNLLLDPSRNASSQLDGQFSIFFNAQRREDNAVNWQESIIHVYKGEWWEETELDNIVNSHIVNPDRKSARFSTPKYHSDGPWSFNQNGICNEIQNLASRSTRSLHLLVQENDLKFWTSKKAIYEPQDLKFWSLQETIQNPCSMLSSQRAGVRYVLAFLVASSFLQMSGSPWLAAWNQKQQISFLGTASGFSLGGIGPYLSTQLNENGLNKSSENDSTRRTRLHPYPEILILGILLLQIWLGKPIKVEREDNHSKPKSPYDDVDAYIPAAEEMLQQYCRNDSMTGFDDAINACINPLHFNPGHSFEDEKFREEVYKAIVGPIEYIVREGFRLNIENKDNLHSFLGTPAALHPPVTVPSPNHESADSRCKLDALARSNNAIFTDETNNGLLAQSANIGRFTDDWIKTMEGNIHIFLSNDVDGKYTLFKNNILRPVSMDSMDERPRAVRIAILDTGINLPKSTHLKFADRVKGYKDWVGTSDERNKWVDTDGHGTHAAALLLREAPHAEVYVARVFIGKNNKGESEISSEKLNGSITEAICYAVDTWKVDIISMSFGFGKSPASIDRAILYAHSKSVIMFAAVGNSGGNSPIHFPARSSNVIAINATDGLGNRAPFTASLRSDDSNFALPGIDVESSWPVDLGKGLKMRASGTSCATPIAAAVAANILEIAGLQLEKAKQAGQTSQDEEDDWKKLSTRGGMRTAFRLMSTKRHGSFGYDNIQPWNFFPPGPPGYSKIESAMDALLRGLRNEN